MRCDEKLLIFLACGTKGDVLPLLSLAVELRTLDGLDVVFCTHSAHKDWVDYTLIVHGIHTRYFTSLPARVWDIDTIDTQTARQETESTSESATELHRRECAEACKDCHAIVYNLFSLEGFHIAEALGVPAVAISPCIIAYSQPAAQRAHLFSKHPQLRQHLESANMLDDFNHWMWPLFDGDRWGSWRQEVLQLPLMLRVDGTTQKPTLLYGISELLSPRQGHWPAGVHMTGAWSLPPASFPPYQATIPRHIEEFISINKHKGPVVCVDFGSMGSMGLLTHPAALVAVLSQTAQGLCGTCFVVMCHGWKPLLKAVQSCKDDLVIAVEHSVCHDALFPLCTALLCHGGSGTVAAGMRAGLPLVIAPFHFDQHQWAERIEWLGCGVEIKVDDIMPSDMNKVGEGAQKLARAVQRVTGEKNGVIENCKYMQQELRKENGVQKAVQLILECVTPNT